jgi:hypothetical protein
MKSNLFIAGALCIVSSLTVQAQPWTIDGNAGTTAGTHFLGTTDDQPLELKVYGRRVMRAEPYVSLNHPNDPELGAPNIVIGADNNTMAPDVEAGNFLAGGSANSIGSGALDSYIIGGAGNEVHGFGEPRFSGIVGGVGNLIGGRNIGFANFSIILGGQGNQVAGSYAVVLGGRQNLAAGQRSLAAGYNAKADHAGSFVWADSAVEGDFHSMAANSFNIRSHGGAKFQSGLLTFQGVPYSTGVRLPPGGGAWQSLSHRDSKENFRPVDSRAVLDQVSRLPIHTWNYKTQAKTIRHIGPVSQDFQQAFKVGEDEEHITTIDADGVALAAIQGLNQKLNEKLEEQRQALENRDAEIKALRDRLDALAARIDAKR